VQVEGPEEETESQEPCPEPLKHSPLEAQSESATCRAGQPSYANVPGSGLDWVTANLERKNPQTDSAHVPEKQETPLPKGVSDRGATKRLVSRKGGQGTVAEEAESHGSKRMKADVGSDEEAPLQLFVPKKVHGIRETRKEGARLREVVFHLVLPEGVAQGHGGFCFEVSAQGPSLTDEKVPLSAAPYERRLWSSKPTRVRDNCDQRSLWFNFVVARKKSGLMHSFSRPEEARVSRDGYKLEPGRHQFCFVQNSLERHMADQELPTKADAVLTYVGMLLGEVGAGRGLAEVLGGLGGLHAQVCSSGWFDRDIAILVLEGLVTFFESFEPGAPGCARARALLCIAGCVIFGRFTELQDRTWWSRAPATASTNRELGGQVMAMLGAFADVSGGSDVTSEAREMLRPVPSLLVKATAPSSGWLLHLEGLAAADPELAFVSDVREGTVAKKDRFCADLRAALPFLSSCPEAAFLRILARVIFSAPCAEALLEALQLERLKTCDKPVPKHVAERLSKLLQTRGAVEIDPALLHLCENLRPLLQFSGLADELRGHVIRLARSSSHWAPQNLQTLSELVLLDHFDLFASKKVAEALLRGITQSPSKQLQCLIPSGACTFSRCWRHCRRKRG
jgi:hypothetical protein